MTESRPRYPHLDRLVRLVPPPIAPVAADGDWTAVESKLGIRLPADYMAFVAIYGSGLFDDFLEVMTPFSRPGENLLDFGAETMLQTLRNHRESGAEIGYPIHPERAGLLPWGFTGNADWCYWLADPPDEPDRWRILINGRGDDRYWEHAGPLTAALADVLSGTLSVPVIDPTFPGPQPAFVSLPAPDEPDRQPLPTTSAPEVGGSSIADTPDRDRS